MTATLQDWLTTATSNYAAAVECFNRATQQAGRDGDPVAFDQWLRLATWHVQATGVTVAMARAVSDRAVK